MKKIFATISTFFLSLLFSTKVFAQTYYLQLFYGPGIPTKTKAEICMEEYSIGFCYEFVKDKVSGVKDYILEIIVAIIAIGIGIFVARIFKKKNRKIRELMEANQQLSNTNTNSVNNIETPIPPQDYQYVDPNTCNNPEDL